MVLEVRISPDTRLAFQLQLVLVANTDQQSAKIFLLCRVVRLWCVLSYCVSLLSDSPGTVCRRIHDEVEVP